VWVRSAAIRPVPAFAQLPRDALTSVEDCLASDENAEQTLSEAFERFETEQPALAERIGNALARTGNEVALALGYFLTLTVWIAFDLQFASRLAAVTSVALTGVEELITLDEELRRADPTEALDTEDVIAMEQPELMRFIGEHLEAALETEADTADVDAIHEVYRLLLIEVLALSYAVQPSPTDPTELSTEAFA